MFDYAIRAELLRSNERLKHVVGVATNLATALAIAAFARLAFVGSFELASMIWLVAASLIIWASSHALNMLEAEDA